MWLLPSASVIILCGIQALASVPEVEIPLGKIRGQYKETINKQQFIAFEGIPYAKPPVGKSRFREAQPVKPWQGIWEATTLYQCLQYNHFTKPGDDFVVGDEDCLYLNIYTTNLNINLLKDVIIFIHGGAFMFNSGSSYGPNIIMEREVVYITLNYRLGPLGFLSTEDNVVPGNNGLKDQVLALKWIKDNIKYFGGNPNSIMLTGMSAGGASVQLHALSPLSQGLFNRGIVQSGTSLNAWVLVENALEKTKTIADLLGCSANNNKAIINCLKRRPARQIVSTVKTFLPYQYNPFSPFGVVIDKWSTNPMIPEHPYFLLKAKKVQDVPLIFSHVESEGLYPAADFIGEPTSLDEIDQRWDELIPYILDFNNTIKPEKKVAVAQKIRKEYFNDSPLTRTTFPLLVKMVGDRMFISDIVHAARLHAATVKSPIYYYYFSYRGAHSKSELRSGCNENYGAAHGDDAVYVLSSVVNTQTTEQDRRMSKLLVDMWISFAKNGIPNIPITEWLPLSKQPTDDVQYLHIKSPTEISMESADSLGNDAFWENLKLKENANFINVKDEL